MLTHTQLGAKLKEVRENSGFTQSTAADKLGISRQKIISVEKGVGPIDTVLLTHMANIYGYSIDYFLNDSNSDVDIQLAFRATELDEEDQRTINWARKVLINIRNLNDIIKEDQ